MKVMGRKMKKAVALMMGGVTALSLTACGGNKNTSDQPASGTSQSADVTQETSQGVETGTANADGQTAADTDSGEKAVISIMAPQFTSAKADDENTIRQKQLYEEYTNTVVDWRWEADDTYNEKLGIAFMDKDNMPMIIVSPRAALPSAVLDAAKKGAFWDVGPYLADYPNLSQANENVVKAFTVDGQVIGVYRGRELGRYGFAYRTDWAEAVGITKEPETIEEVYDMLYQFTYGDPDGNGKDDTYGLDLTKYTGPFDIMQTWFGVGNEWVEKDGNLVPVHQTQEYREALKWFRKLYEEGIIRSDWATIDSSSFGEACKKGEAGAYVDTMGGAKAIWKYYNDNDIKSVTALEENASVTMVGPVNGHTMSTPGHSGVLLITKYGAKTEEDLKNCLYFLDKMCDEEMRILGDNGLEGVTYDITDEKVVMRKGVDVSLPNINQSCAYIPFTLENPQHPVEKDELGLAEAECYEKNRPVAVYNPALGYLANSEVNTEVGTDIELVIDDARTQYICGQIDEAGLDAADKLWLERGGDRLVEELNQMYHDDLAK